MKFNVFNAKKSEFPFWVLQIYQVAFAPLWFSYFSLYILCYWYTLTHNCIFARNFIKKLHFSFAKLHACNYILSVRRNSHSAPSDKNCCVWACNTVFTAILAGKSRSFFARIIARMQFVDIFQMQKCISELVCWQKR